MDLYYGIHLDQLENILECGLGITLGETENIPIQLDLYSCFAQASRMMNDYKNGVQTLSDIVVLSVQSASITDNCLEPLRTANGHTIRYICSEIIDSSSLALVWAGYDIPLIEFMNLYAQLKENGVAVSGSETLIKCVQWFMMGNEKHETIFNIIGHGRHFDDVATLTGYSAELLRKLWSDNESAVIQFIRYKESYEEGIILGMFESGFSIEEIEKKVNWSRDNIRDFLLEEGLLNP